MAVFAAAWLSPAGGQTAAVFNNYSATIKGLTVGTSQCTMWQLAGPWRIEVACYAGGVLKFIEAGTADETLVGSFPLLDGSGTIGWLVKPTGAATIVFDARCGTTCGAGGALPNSTSFSWNFPPGN